jgi:DNA-binding NtrC family response regulator
MTDARPILVVDDEEQMQKAMEELLQRKGYRTVCARNGKEALQRIEQGGLRMVISDVRMPEVDGITLLSECRRRAPWLPFILISAVGNVREAVEAVKKGAEDYLMKPFSVDELLAKIRSMDLATTFDSRDGGIVTRNPRMLEILGMAKGVAASDVSVVITGESGTGKELLARFLHDHSGRRNAPFVSVNCASIPETLLESELFGHEKGSFTGANHRRTGKFEMAHEGTLLLDEIGEMRPSLQAKLLRVLQEKEVERVGGERPVRVDFRTIATTNRELLKDTLDGRFREDLYYRLNVVPFHLPPLRERAEDIPLLVEHFNGLIAHRLGLPPKEFSDQAVKKLRELSWRGNIRELKNVVERAVVLSKAPVLEPGDLYLDAGAGTGNAERAVVERAARRPAKGIRAMEKDLILKTLQDNDGNRSHTARMLGISVRTLRNKLKAFGLPAGERCADAGAMFL